MSSGLASEGFDQDSNNSGGGGLGLACLGSFGERVKPGYF